MFGKRLSEVCHAAFAEKQRQTPDVIEPAEKPESSKEKNIRSNGDADEYPAFDLGGFRRTDTALTVFRRLPRALSIERIEDLVGDHEAERHRLHDQFCQRQPMLQVRIFRTMRAPREEPAQILMFVVAFVIAQMRMVARHMLVLIGELASE